MTNKRSRHLILLLGLSLLLVSSIIACQPAPAPVAPTPTLTPTPEPVDNGAATHLVQGDTYAEQGQWDEAIVEYGKAIDLDPNDAINAKAYWLKNESNDNHPYLLYRAYSLARPSS